MLTLRSASTGRNYCTVDARREARSTTGRAAARRRGPVAAVVGAYAAQRGSTTTTARGLHVAQWCATAVDATVQPRQWRYRSALTGDDCTLRIQRTGDGPPLIVAADWRPRG